MQSVRDGSGILVGLEIVGSARDPATGEKCNRMQRSNPVPSIQTALCDDRIDPCDLLGLLDRLDIEIDHDGFVVAAHKDTFERLILARIDFLVQAIVTRVGFAVGTAAES